MFHNQDEARRKGADNAPESAFAAPKLADELGTTGGPESAEGRACGLNGSGADEEERQRDSADSVESVQDEPEVAGDKEPRQKQRQAQAQAQAQVQPQTQTQRTSQQGFSQTNNNNNSNKRHQHSTNASQKGRNQTGERNGRQTAGHSQSAAMQQASGASLVQLSSLEQAQTAPPQISADYLGQLIKDKKQLASMQTSTHCYLHHLPRLLDEEIGRVRQQLLHLQDLVHGLPAGPLQLPEPVGEPVQLQEKIFVPVDQHPEYNFVGRILGPRGMTAKQLEQETGCKIMIRGRGSMRDKKKASPSYLIFPPLSSTFF